MPDPYDDPGSASFLETGITSFAEGPGAQLADDFIENLKQMKEKP